MRMTAARGIITETARKQPPEQDAGKEVVRGAMANTFNTLKLVGTILINHFVGVISPPFHRVLISHATLLEPLDGAGLSGPDGNHAVRA